MAFTRALVGSGTAALFFVHHFGEEVNATQTRYDFASSEPVPEPTTLLLLGSGAAAITARRRRLTAETD